MDRPERRDGELNAWSSLHYTFFLHSSADMISFSLVNRRAVDNSRDDRAHISHKCIYTSLIQKKRRSCLAETFMLCLLARLGRRSCLARRRNCGTPWFGAGFGVLGVGGQRLAQGICAILRFSSFWRHRIAKFIRKRERGKRPLLGGVKRRAVRPCAGVWACVFAPEHAVPPHRALFFSFLCYWPLQVPAEPPS